jgi:hypothetical protein
MNADVEVPIKGLISEASYIPEQPNVFPIDSLISEIKYMRGAELVFGSEQRLSGVNNTPSWKPGTPSHEPPGSCSR